MLKESEKTRDLTQSYDETPLQTENAYKNIACQQNTHKKFEYPTDRLTMVSLSNYSPPTFVINLPTLRICALKSAYI